MKPLSRSGWRGRRPDETINSRVGSWASSRAGSRQDAVAKTAQVPCQRLGARSGWARWWFTCGGARNSLVAVCAGLCARGCIGGEVASQWIDRLIAGLAVLLAVGGLTTVAEAADVAITKVGPATAASAEQFVYTLTVTNAGPGPAANVHVNNGEAIPLYVVGVAGPAGWTCAVVFDEANCTTPSLGAGASAVITVTVQVPANVLSGSFTAAATVSTTTTDPNPANNWATATVVITQGVVADLAITNTAPAQVNIGEQITRTIVVTNNGPSPATTVTMTDAVTFFTSFASLTSPAGWTCATPPLGSEGPVNCTTPSMTAGTTASFVLTVDVVQNLLSTSSQAKVSSATPDPNTGNNAATATTQVGLVRLNERICLSEREHLGRRGKNRCHLSDQHPEVPTGTVVFSEGSTILATVPVVAMTRTHVWIL